jgi:hypothetical protein
MNNIIGKSKNHCKEKSLFLLKKKTDKTKIPVKRLFNAKIVGKVIRSNKKGIKDLLVLCS